MTEARQKLFACFGDSITSDQVTGIGTVVAAKIGAELIGNFACGYATCSDWHENDVNTTPVTLEVPQNTNTADNVLSNQIRRILQYTTAAGETIRWMHPIDGEFTIDRKVGTGLGHTNKNPDLIYIAVGTNDGNNVQNTFVDDTDEILGQSYKQLTRTSFATALRWAVETLQSAYPEARIYVATPLQTASVDTWMSYEAEDQKRTVVKRICEFCGVECIDSFAGSGFTAEVAIAHNTDVHPEEETKEMIAEYVANEIKNSCFAKTN